MDADQELEIIQNEVSGKQMNDVVVVAEEPGFWMNMLGYEWI